MTDSSGRVPGRVNTVAMRDLCSLIVDSEHKTAPKDPEGLHPLMRTTNLGRAQGDFRRAQRIDAQTYERWTKRARPQADDLILAREAPVGGVCRVPANVLPALGQRTVLLRPRPGLADSRFLMYRLAAPDMQARMNEMATGATVPHLNMADIRALEIPDVPEIADQRRRGAVLRAFDELIEVNERRIELLEDLARSLYREWFIRFRFPGHEDANFVESDLGLIPEGWAVARLGDLATLRYGKALPSPKRRPGPYAVVSSAGVVGEHDEAFVPAPGIVVGRKGNVGSVWWLDRPFFPIDTTYYVETDVPLGLMYWQLKDLAFIDSHAAVPGLSRNQAESLRVLDVDGPTARLFEAIHGACFGHIAQLRAQNNQVAATRDLLLPRLVTGHLDISGIDLGAQVSNPEEA